jgi:hypothetical protein
MLSLHSLLEKLGLSPDKLTEEEKKTYEQWSQTLSQPDVTIDDLKKFLPSYIDRLEYDLNNYENSKDKDLYLKAVLRNAKMMLAFITGPEKRREWLEKHIEQRIK